jgi:hypothetical protein
MGSDLNRRINWFAISAIKPLWYPYINALRPSAVIVVHHLLGCPANLTHLPPAPRQGPFSHCQRPFGLKTTTRNCHVTSHPVGHSIR